jgi:hypothetical protein
VIKDGGVEVTDVVGSSKPGPGLVAQPQNLALPDEITQRLAGKSDVAVYLGIDEDRRDGRGSSSRITWTGTAGTPAS